MADPNFKITSKEDHSYNCIAWAAIKSDIFWWPSQNANILDGLDWPFNLPFDLKLETFIRLYENLDYEKCDSWEYEHNFQKIAIYVDKTDSCTHAARQNFNGLWTSKLGRYEDIAHSNPFSIQNDEYGNAVQFMKRENLSYDIKRIKKGVIKASK